MEKRTSLFYSPKLHLIIIILLTGLAYSNIFPNTFIGDDKVFLVNWKDTYHIELIPQLFTQGLMPQSQKGAGYRPLRSTIIILLHQLTGTNTLGFHMYSLLVLLLSTIFAYLIIMELTQNQVISFTTALLFALHPIHTEAITFMLGSIDSTGALFLLVSFYLYIRKKHIYLSAFIFLLALFTNEITMVLPLLVILYESIFNNLTFKNAKRAKFIKLFLPLILAGLFYLAVRFSVFGTVTKGTYLAGSFYLTMLTMTKVVIRYIQLLIWPYNLSNNHLISPGIQSIINPYSSNLNYPRIISQKISDPDIILNILIITGIVLIFFKAIKKLPVLSFAIGWFFISLLPIINIIPIDMVLQERYVYLASFGFCLALALLINWLCENFRGLTPKILISIFFILYLIFYFHQTYQRNYVWRNPVTFWENLAMQLPDDGATNFYLATLYQDENLDDQALTYFNKAQNISPDSPEVYLYKARIYLKKGDQDKARENLLKSMNLKTGFNYPDWQLFSWQTLTFFYPPSWKASSTSNLLISNPNDNFTVEFSLDTIYQSSQDYLKNQTESYGRLIKEGLAKIPGFELAYVKFWDNNNQFFLFKGRQVLKILVYPIDLEENMKMFDKILASIIFN